MGGGGGSFGDVEADALISSELFALDLPRIDQEPSYLVQSTTRLDEITEWGAEPESTQRQSGALSYLLHSLRTRSLHPYHSS